MLFSSAFARRSACGCVPVCANCKRILQPPLGTTIGLSIAGLSLELLNTPFKDAVHLLKTSVLLR